jgi:hypothetical protein
LAATPRNAGWMPELRRLYDSSIPDTELLGAGARLSLTPPTVAVIRGLGCDGVPVCMLQTDEHSLEGHSRVAARTMVWPRRRDADRPPVVGP